MSEVREWMECEGQRAAEVSKEVRSGLMKERSGLTEEKNGPTDEKKVLRGGLAMVETLEMFEGLLSRPEGS